MSAFNCDLLVVGLGPVGEVLAGLAAQQGLSVIAIERETDPFPLPRAAVFDHEIMRIFQMLGVAERIAPLCRIPDRYQFLTPDRQVLLDFDLSQPSAVSGWAETYALHQPAVEAVLRQRMIELGVDVRLGVAFTGLDQDEDGATVRVRSAAGDQTIRARYVVGCDGGSSPVREAVGIDLFDYQFDEPWLVIDALVDDPGDLPLTCLQLCDPVRPMTYLAMSPPRFRWEFMLNPGETADQITSDDSLRALLAPWDCFDRLTIERKAIYRFHGLVANEWRQGRVLLAGDAPHQMPPFAGQGMCSGIRDAANLAWKLGLVVRDGIDDSLLDTYQAEREPHVRAVIETAIAMGRVVCLRDPDAAAERNAGMLARKAAGEQDVSIAYPDLSGGLLTATPGAGSLFPQVVAQDGRRIDDILGPGAWLIGHGVAQNPAAGVMGIDIGIAEFSALAAPIDRWLAAHQASAVLVRPDRHVFGTGEPQALLASWADGLGRADVLDAVA